MISGDGENLQQVVTTAMEPLRKYLQENIEKQNVDVEIAGALYDKAVKRIDEAFNIVKRDVGLIQFSWRVQTGTVIPDSKLIAARVNQSLTMPSFCLGVEEGSV